MSDVSPHDELIKNFESAVDMSKFMGVFSSLVAIIKDQQSKIDDLTAKSDRMALLVGDTNHRRPSVQSDIMMSALDSDDALVRGLAEKVLALETKLNDTLLELHGLGEDNSILDREEEPPEFLSLPDSGTEQPPSLVSLQSKRFTATAPAIEEHIGYEDEDPSSPMGFSGVPSAVVSKRPSLNEGKTAGQEDDAEVAAATEDTQEDVKDITPLVSNHPSAGTSPLPEAPVSAEEDQPPTPAEREVVSRVPSRVPSPAAPTQRPESPIAPAPSVPHQPASSPTPHQRLHQHHNRSSFRSDCSEDSHASHFHPPNRMSSVLSAVGNANTRGLLTVTPMEMRPSTMRESFSTKLHQVEHELFPNRENLEDREKYSPKSRSHLRASFGRETEESAERNHAHLHPRIVPHFLKFHTDAPPPPRERMVALAEYRTLRTREHGDKMDAANLTLLPYEKRAKLIRKLKQKGRFIQISRNMLEESRQKYAARSLKQNVEYVEAETRRLFNKVAGIKDILKRQHTALRYLLPADFHETYDRLVDFLEHLELRGGVEELMALPRANRIVAYEEDGGVPKGLIDAIVAKVRPIVLQEVSGVRSQLQSLKDEALTSAQLAEIMCPEDGPEGGRRSRGGSAGANGSDPLAKEKDLVRRRTVNLIKECVEEQLAREREISAAEEAHKVTVGTVLHQEVPAAAANTAMQRPKSQSMILIQNQTIDAANRQYVDEKLRQFEEQLTALRLNVDSNKDNSSNDLAFLTAKLETLEAATSQIQQHDLETQEQRRKDSEALKIMQKRLANVSIDNVMDELKVLQLQVNDRPSTSDVGNMMESISHTFRKHLGENVVGLRGLVDQVYRQIHHKVNREDIKKLISAKLAQMEADILRREEEMFNMASSVRCMSCGQLPPDPTNAFAGHTGARRVGAVQGSAVAARGQGQHQHHPQVGGADSVGALTTGASSMATPSGTANGGGGGVSVASSHGGRTGMLRQSHRPSTSPSVAEDQEYAPFNPSDPSSSSLLFNSEEANGTANVGGEVGEASQQAGSQMDDDISLHSEHSGNYPSQSLQPLSLQSSSILGPVRSEEIYNVITGTAGLKSLMPQHTPLIPVRDPYGITTAHHQRTVGPTTTTTGKPLKRVEKVPEPLYRKAKMAAHLKEMVKVAAPSVQNYGFSVNNPFFVLDGYAADDAEAQQLAQLEGGSSLLSHRSGAAGAGGGGNGGGGGQRSRPKTQGAIGQQVYVPIARSSMHPQSSTTQHMLMSASQNGVGQGLGVDGSGRSDHSVSSVLPYIHAKQTIH